MAPHSSTLAWKIPWMEEPGGLQSMGSLRVGSQGASERRGILWRRFLNLPQDLGQLLLPWQDFSKDLLNWAFAEGQRTG